MNLAGDAGGLAEEAVGELEVVVEPPFGGALHVARVDVERAAQALINGRVARLHLLHQQFLFGAAHRHENDVLLRRGDVREQPSATAPLPPKRRPTINNCLSNASWFSSKYCTG